MDAAGAAPPAAPRVNAPARPQPKAGAATKPADSTRVWEAYALAYQDRYGVEPVRNAKVNKQLGWLLTRISLAEAPAIAGFYVRHNNAYYVRRGHAIDCLLQDAEKLRMEWATGNRITAARARDADQRQTTVDMTERLIEKYRREGRLTEDPANAH